MIKSTKKLVVYIVVCTLLVCAISIIFIKSIINDNSNTQSINEIDDSNINITDNNNKNTNEVDSIISKDTINDLKDNLGKGTNGDVNKVEQTVNENGEEEYIFHYTDGTTQTVTIKDAEGESGIEEMTNIDEPDPIIEEEPKQEEPVVQEEEPQTPPEASGTVYERFSNMTSKEQYAFYKSFNSHSEYMEWYKAAQAEYNALHPVIEIGSNKRIEIK